MRPARFFCALKLVEPDQIIYRHAEISCDGYEIAHGRFAQAVFPQTYYTFAHPKTFGEFHLTDAGFLAQLP